MGRWLSAKTSLPHSCSLSCENRPGITPSCSPMSSDHKETTKGILDKSYPWSLVLWPRAVHGDRCLFSLARL